MAFLCLNGPPALHLPCGLIVATDSQPLQRRMTKLLPSNLSRQMDTRFPCCTTDKPVEEKEIHMQAAGRNGSGQTWRSLQHINLSTSLFLLALFKLSHCSTHSL